MQEIWITCTVDPWLNNPDPYVVVEALGSDRTHKKQTRHIDGTVDPTWNQNLNFGCQSWEKFLMLQV